jgi:hypothetical protein
LFLSSYFEQDEPDLRDCCAAYRQFVDPVDFDNPVQSPAGVMNQLRAGLKPVATSSAPFTGRCQPGAPWAWRGLQQGASAPQHKRQQRYQF